MNIWSKFKEELGKGYDQVNMLDGGKSYKTRTVSEPLPDEIKNRYKYVADNKGATPVVYKNTIGDRVRDVFDANSYTDALIRQQRGEAADYREQQLAAGNKRPYQNFGSMIFGNTARFLNTGSAAVREVQDTAKMYAAQMTNNPEAYRNAVRENELFKQTAYQPNSGLLGQGTIFDNPEEFDTLGAKDITKRVGATTGGTMLEVAPFSKGAGIGATTFYQGLTKPAQVFTRTVAGATEGALQDVLEQQLTYDQWRPQQTVASALLGGTIPNAGDVVKGGVKVVKKGNDIVQDEVASVGGMKNLLDPTKDNEFMQYRTNYDTYAKAWEKETNPTLKKQIEVGLKQELDNMARRFNELKQNTGTSLGSGPMAGYDALNRAKAKNAEQALNDSVNKVFPDAKELQVKGATETVQFNGKPHTIADSLKTGGDTKYLLKDADGKEIWTNQAGLDTARDATTSTVKVAQPEPTPTIRVNGEVKKGQTQSIGDLLPDLQARRAQNLTPATEIANRYGGKVADVQRNIDRYGVEATNNMYARKSDALPFNPDTGQGIKNIDAVVTAELKKQYPDKAGVRVTSVGTTKADVVPESEVLQAGKPTQTPGGIPITYTKPTVKVTPEPTVKVEAPIEKTPKTDGVVESLTKKHGIKLKPETVDINTLKTSKGVVEDFELTDAIKENGVVPLLVDNSGMIFEGQHRLESLKKLGAKDVPIYRVDIDQINKTPEDKLLNFLDDYNDTKTQPVSAAPTQKTPTYYRGIPDNSHFEKMGDTPPARESDGIYITSKKKYAKTFAGDNGKIQKVEADIKNPFVIKDKNDMYIIEGARTWPEKIEELKALGHDSIIAPDGQVYVFDGSKAKVVSETPLLKSRIKNILKRNTTEEVAKSGAPIENTPTVKVAPKPTVKVEAPTEQPTVKVTDNTSDIPVNEKLQISKELNSIAEEQKQFVPHSAPWEELQLRGEELSKKLYKSSPEVTPEPTIKVVNGQRVDTTTGEILDTPAQQGTLQDFVKNLPDPAVTSRQDADRLIGEGTEWLRKGAQTIDDVLQKNGDSYENFSRAIHKANIEGTEPPKLYADLYDQFIKPALDSFRDASGRVVGENIGDVKRYYMPRVMADDVGEEVLRGNSLVKSIDTEEFGSAISRRKDDYQLGVDDIDHSPEGLSRYATQSLSERYRSSIAADEVIQEAKTRGVDIDEPTARKIVEDRNSLAKEIKDAANKGGVVSSGLEKMDIVKRIGDIGTAKGKEKFVLDKGLSWAKRQITDSDELYDIPYGGSGKTVGEEFGFVRFTEADGQAVRLEKEVTDNGLNVTDHLTERYADIAIDETVKKEIIQKAQKRIDFIDNTLANIKDKNGVPRFTDEDLAVRRQMAYRTAEKNIAREQATEFLENTEIADKQLRKNINQDAKRILVQDLASRSFADKLVNGLVGIKHVGLLGYSLMTAVLNGIETKRVFAKYGTKEYADAMRKAATDIDITHRYGVTETKVGDILDQNGKKANPKIWKPMGLFQASERFKDAALLHAAESHYKKLGLDGEELFQAVYRDFNKYGIKYGQIGSLGFNKSKTGRIVGQFMQYPIKDWTIRVNEFVKAVGGKNATEFEKRQAQKYLARDIPATAAIYLALNAALGTSWEQIVGVSNPVQSNPLPSDATTDMKVVNSIPGGPFVQDAKDLYLAIRMAYLEREEGDSVGIGDVVNNELKKDAATYVPGGQQLINRTGGFIADQMRGYDENSQGRARYEAADDPVNIIKGLLFGGYTTDNAREYYGNTGVASDIIGSEPKRPVNQRYQDEINKGADPGEIIAKSRSGKERDKQFYDSPQGKAWSELNSTVYNEATGKYESDVVSPEKWRGVQADKSDATYTQLKDAANQRNRDFGDPLDPLYSDKWGKYRKEILAMRSQYTGDDKEMKDIANATQPWYKEYMKDYINYINEMKGRDYQSDSKYGVTERVKQYWELSAQNPSIPEISSAKYPLIAEYYKVKNSNPEAGKQFYKDNADALSAAFKQQTVDKFNWTNQMRALEGAEPLPWDVFQNITFGYEADEMAAFRALGYKLGQFGGGGGNGVSVRKGDFGEQRAAPDTSKKVKVSKVKVVPTSKKSTITIKRTGKRI